MPPLVSTLSIFLLFLFISSISLLCLFCLWQCTFVNMSTFADQDILDFDIIDQDITILDILIKVPPLLLCVVTAWSTLVPSRSTAPDHIFIIFLLYSLIYIHIYSFYIYFPKSLLYSEMQSTKYRHLNPITFQYWFVH